MDIGVMTMRVYSTFHRSPELIPYYQMHTQDTPFLEGGGFALSRGYNQHILSLVDRAIYIAMGFYGRYKKQYIYIGAFLLP